MPSRVLLCPPTYFEVRDRKNPYMRSAIDRNKAQAQWQALCHAFRSAGLELEFIAPVKGLEDMVFAANQVFVGCHPSIGKFVVPSEMRYPSRQKEVPYYVEWFQNHGYKIIALDLRNEYLEGGGDLLWHPDKSRIWAGFGIRSSKGGIAKFSSAMEQLSIPVTPLRLIDEYFYHLDTCLSPLNAEAALFYPGAFSEEAQQALTTVWKRLYPVNRDEALRFLCNGVAANGIYITAVETPSLERALGQEGIRSVFVDTSEFEKSGGSVYCMKMFLD
jgi:N-dimethylarginine dimethylaminohydrolase